ncbi:MAG: hypothetical protein HN640_03900 [Gammaproteobacteria bacterium]|jgi:hypothetical protein|nr:hypothetical protein [Gammaproteobacteria bacterium]MBT4655069.1 hypothetical protein [Gammaproteobacteria bacterium]MBT7322719.1 hypothetical protein [Gammaproteobacteria bacterium]MBT7932621.1 hypothetical protein [Gammaproteobacteria bacterium]
MKNKYVLILIMLMPTISLSQSLNYPLFNDYVQFSSSVDAYSVICVKNFNEEEARFQLFDLIFLLQEKTNLSENDILELEKKYSDINKSTISQLIQLGVNKNRALCSNYLKVFERFDAKKMMLLMRS